MPDIIQQSIDAGLAVVRSAPGERTEEEVLVSSRKLDIIEASIEVGFAEMKARPGVAFVYGLLGGLSFVMPSNPAAHDLDEKMDGGEHTGGSFVAAMNGLITKMLTTPDAMVLCATTDGTHVPIGLDRGLPRNPAYLAMGFDLPLNHYRPEVGRFSRPDDLQCNWL